MSTQKKRKRNPRLAIVGTSAVRGTFGWPCFLLRHTGRAVPKTEVLQEVQSEQTESQLKWQLKNVPNPKCCPRYQSARTAKKNLMEFLCFSGSVTGRAGKLGSSSRCIARRARSRSISGVCLCLPMAPSRGYRFQAESPSIHNCQLQLVEHTAVMLLLDHLGAVRKVCDG